MIQSSLFCFFSFRSKLVQYIEGQKHRQGIRCDLGPDNSVHAKQFVQKEEHRNVKDQPSDNSQEQGDPPFSKGLKHTAARARSS